MRKALVIAVLLMAGSAALGATVLREPFAAAATPFEHVIIANDPTQAIPVREQNVDANGNIKVTGTLGISSTDNTVNLGATDSGNLDSANKHLANIDSQTSKLNFDSSGSLETTSNPAAPTNGACWNRFDISAGDTQQWNCSSTANASLVLVGNADDSVQITFLNQSGNPELSLFGSGDDGNEQWQLPLSQPIPIGAFRVRCDNFVEDCKLFVEVVGSF